MFPGLTCWEAKMQNFDHIELFELTEAEIAEVAGGKVTEGQTGVGGIVD